MGSPFPGVDPYLESQHYWPDFHATFLPCWREAISDVLPQPYEARIDERVQIIESGGSEHSFLPDVAVVERDSGRERTASARRGAATIEAVTVALPALEEVRETQIHILHRPERKLVAVLELLSPANKSRPGRDAYWSKRMELLQEPVHLVELDLLLSGERLPMGRSLPPGDFYAIVARADRRRLAEVYAWRLRDRLPSIPIPLLRPDGDIFVDLAEVFARAYEMGRYERSVDYSAELKVPLDEGAVQWARETARRH